MEFHFRLNSLLKSSVIKPSVTVLYMVQNPNRSLAVLLLRFPDHTPLETSKAALLWVSGHLVSGVTVVTTHKKHKTNIHSFNRIRTCNPLNRKAEDLFLRPQTTEYVNNQIYPVGIITNWNVSSSFKNFPEFAEIRWAKQQLILLYRYLTDGHVT